MIERHRPGRVIHIRLTEGQHHKLKLSAARAVLDPDQTQIPILPIAGIGCEKDRTSVSVQASGPKNQGESLDEMTPVIFAVATTHPIGKSRSQEFGGIIPDERSRQKIPTSNFFPA